MRNGVHRFWLGAVVGAVVVAAGGGALVWLAPGESGDPAPVTDDVAEGAVEGLATDELYALARRRLYFAKDAPAARRALECLLGRDLDPGTRVEVLTDLGIACRTMGDHQAALEVLTLAMDAVGIEDPSGALAAFQIMWTHRQKGDLSSATVWGDRIVATRPESRQLAVAVHRALGLFARDGGDEGRARRELETALKIAGDDPALLHQREEIRGILPRRE